MVRAAAATALLDKELGSLDGSTVRSQRALDRNTSSVNKNAQSLEQLESRARRAERSSSLLGDAIVGLGPAVLPISALAVPAIAGLSAQLGFAVAGAGSMILAFHGMGAALKAVDAYQLEPTTANLQKMHEEMAKLGPAGRSFVHELDALEPKLKSLKVAAENGLLPGAEESIKHLLTLLPQVRRIISTVSLESGNLLADAGKNLAGPEFKDFFTYLETEAAPMLSDLGRTVGNFAAGIAHLFVGLAPAERDFSTFMLSASRGFNSWADGLDQTQGFQEFMDYIHETGPDVADALGSIANAFVQILQAGAPLGGPILQSLATLADIIARIADSPIGTPLIALASGLALVNRALAISALAKGSLVADLITGNSVGLTRSRNSIRGLTSDMRVYGSVQNTAAGRARATAGQLDAQAAASGRLGDRLKTVGKGAAVLGGVTLMATGAADGIGLTNTASLALAGTMFGPLGTAVGAGVGGFLDLNASAKHAAEGARDYQKALEGIDPAPIRAKIKELEAAGVQRPTGTLPPVRFLGGRGAGGAAVQAAEERRKIELLGQSYAALDRIAGIKNARIGAANTTLLAHGLVLTADGARSAAQTLAQFDAALANSNADLSHQSDLVNYHANLDALTQSLKANGHTLDLNTVKGQANKSAMIQFAQGAIQYANGLKTVGQGNRFLDGARTAFMRAAAAAGFSKAQAGALARELHLLDRIKAEPHVLLRPGSTKAQISGIAGALAGLSNKVATPKIRVDVGASYQAIAGVAAGLGNLRDRTVHVRTVQSKALGGPIYGPGGPRQDNIPIMASAGEFMVNANAYSKYAREVEWINAQGLAAGGRVGSPPISVGGPDLSGMQVVVRVDGVAGAFRGEVESIAHGAARDVVAGQRNQDSVRGLAGEATSW
jgi:hypothetical protein